MKASGLILCGGLLLGAAFPPTAAAGDARYFTFYVQQAWPKQSTTNNQIGQINQAFGTHFEDWGDVANLSAGAQLFWRVTPRWKFGVQVDYSSGAIQGRAQVPTEAGPAELSFEQRYGVYADLYAVGQWLLRPDARRVQPFLYGGLGVAYERDRTTLRLRNDFIDSGLRVRNDGWFPSYTAGIGVDVVLPSRPSWYFEFGVAYVWARMTNQVPATGDLAPSPRVTADTDLTGPNYWLGIGHSF